jgi:hypothetical protein
MGLDEVRFESGSRLKRIERFAFSEISIGKIEIPSSVEFIGEKCFFGCKYCSRIGFEMGSSLKTIGDYAFCGSQSIKMAEIPAKCEILGICSLTAVANLSICRANPFFVVDDKFVKSPDWTVLLVYYGCKKSIVIDNEIEIIPFQCFRCHPFLTHITFRSGSKLRRIEARAFQGVNTLECVRLPRTVECIGDYCFSECEKLKEFSLESGSLLREVGEFALDHVSVKEIEIPSQCEVLTGLSLVGLKNVSISRRNPFFIVDGSFIKSFDKKFAIRYLGKERVITLDNMIERIRSGCFCGTDIEEVKFESASKLRIIEKYAFSRSKLRRIRIPSNIEMIGEGCFSYHIINDEDNDAINSGRCTHAEYFQLTFSLGSMLKSLERDTFVFSSLNIIQIPSSVESIGESCFSRTCLTRITFGIGSVLKCIGRDAFSYSGVASIQIPSGVESIGESCFRNTELEEITFALGLRSKLLRIESQAFENTQLRTIKIPRSVEFIGKSCFRQCRQLVKVTFECGSRVKCIHDRAFLDTGLRAIRLPSMVEFLGEDCLNFWKKSDFREEP